MTATLKDVAQKAGVSIKAEVLHQRASGWRGEGMIVQHSRLDAPFARSSRRRGEQQAVNLWKELHLIAESAGR